jgi:hypothetical protein
MIERQHPKTLVPYADKIAAELKPHISATYKLDYEDVATACDMRTHGVLGSNHLHRLTVMVTRRLRLTQ